jgi:uncharacterized protein
MIEAAENVLRDMGFRDVRVRHHELVAGSRFQVSGADSGNGKRSTTQHLARIEVGPVELPGLLENGRSTRIAEALRQIGYAHVTVDLQGYRRGSLNEVLPAMPAVRAVAGGPEGK